MVQGKELDKFFQEGIKHLLLKSISEKTCKFKFCMTVDSDSDEENEKNEKLENANRIAKLDDWKQNISSIKYTGPIFYTDLLGKAETKKFEKSEKSPKVKFKIEEKRTNYTKTIDDRPKYYANTLKKDERSENIVKDKAYYRNRKFRINSDSIPKSCNSKPDSRRLSLNKDSLVGNKNDKINRKRTIYKKISDFKKSKPKIVLAKRVDYVDTNVYNCIIKKQKNFIVHKKSPLDSPIKLLKTAKFKMPTIKPLEF